VAWWLPIAPDQLRTILPFLPQFVWATQIVSDGIGSISFSFRSNYIHLFWFIVLFLICLSSTK